MISSIDLTEALEPGRDLLRKIPDPIPYTMTGDQAQYDLAELMAGLCFRAGDIHEAMALLVGKSHLAEAATLARSLFEIALTAQYISLKPEERMSAYKMCETMDFYKQYLAMRKLQPSAPTVKAKEQNPHFGRAKKAWENRADTKKWPDRARVAEIIDQELKDRGMLMDDSIESVTFYRWAYRLLYHELSEISGEGGVKSEHVAE